MGYQAGTVHGFVAWPYNLYIETLAEQGLIGLIAILSLLTCALLMGWGTYRTGGNEIRIYMAGTLAGLIGFCFAGMVELSFIRQWVVLILFTQLGMVAHLSGQKKFYREASCAN